MSQFHELKIYNSNFAFKMVASVTELLSSWVKDHSRAGIKKWNCHYKNLIQCKQKSMLKNTTMVYKC